MYVEENKMQLDVFTIEFWRGINAVRCVKKRHAYIGAHIKYRYSISVETGNIVHSRMIKTGNIASLEND